jgi:hypothetical protein
MRGTFQETRSATAKARWCESAVTGVVDRCASVCRILQSTLREIFDESAYARFLARRKLTSSSYAYAEFLNESRQQRERRPRCC